MTLIQRDGYVTNEVQDELVTAALALPQSDPDSPMLYEWLADQIAPPFADRGATLGEALWQVDFTSSGGPLIIGTGAQLHDAGLNTFRAYKEVAGFRSVLADVAAKATEAGCTVWPWSPEQIERLAIVYQSARHAASLGSDDGKESNAASMAGIRAVLSEMARLQTWHADIESWADR